MRTVWALRASGMLAYNRAMENVGIRGRGFHRDHADNADIPKK
jgi:hypothetical protein